MEEVFFELYVELLAYSGGWIKAQARDLIAIHVVFQTLISVRRCRVENYLTPIL